MRCSEHTWAHPSPQLILERRRFHWVQLLADRMRVCYNHITMINWEICLQPMQEHEPSQHLLSPSPSSPVFRPVFLCAGTVIASNFSTFEQLPVSVHFITFYFSRYITALSSSPASRSLLDFQNLPLPASNLKCARVATPSLAFNTTAASLKSYCRPPTYAPRCTSRLRPTWNRSSWSRVRSTETCSRF